AHDALAVGLLTVLDDLHLGLEPVRRLDEPHRRPGVHAEPVADLHLSRRLGHRHLWSARGAVVLAVSSDPRRIERFPTSLTSSAPSAGPSPPRSQVASLISIGRLTPHTTSTAREPSIIARQARNGDDPCTSTNMRMPLPESTSSQALATSRT